MVQNDIKMSKQQYQWTTGTVTDTGNTWYDTTYTNLTSADTNTIIK